MITIQISLLTVINGKTGEKKGGKIINSVVDAIIERDNQFQFSWTGRSSSGAKQKIAFNQYKEIIGVILAVCRFADSNYSRKDCEHDLTYKVFKYANSKRSKDVISFDVGSNNNLLTGKALESIISTVTENSPVCSNQIKSNLETNDQMFSKFLQFLNNSFGN